MSGKATFIRTIGINLLVAQNLNKKNTIVLVSTHDMELADLLEKEYELYHFNETLANGQLSFDYKLKEGKLKTRNAIRILEISGYPEEIIREAGETYDYLAGFHFNNK
ncbi:MAG: hypothetical protein LUH15_04185 [Tannerellaceae bacterium]|nr:hypothetical protein [Tannerellaceae bacterium]